MSYFLWTEELPRKQILENSTEYVDRLISDFALNRSVQIPLIKITKNRTEELLNPKSIAGNLSQFDYNQITSLYNFANNCKKFEIKLSDELIKAFKWHQFLCGQTDLKDSFFASEPYLHPNGHSYIYLATKIKNKRFDQQWLQKHESKTHILEGKELGFEDANADSNNLINIISGQKLSIGSSKVFFVNYEKRIYQEFSRQDWDDYLSKKLLQISEDNNLCINTVDGHCWQIKAQNYFMERMLYPGLLLSLILAMISVIALWRERHIQKKKLQQDKQFLLKLLTHELRTPAASLNLILEKFRDKFDSMPESLQKDFISMSSEISRLN